MSEDPLLISEATRQTVRNGMPQSRRNRLLLYVAGALLLLPASVIYGAFLDSPRFFDDFELANWLGYLQDGVILQPREVARLFSWLNLLIWEPTTQVLRVGNLFLHLCNVLLVWAVGYQLLTLDRRNRYDPRTAIWMAFSGALVFSVHPVAVYGVGYVIQRTILLATLFALAAASFHLRAQTSARSVWLVPAVACYALSVFSKEHSVLLPAVLAAASVWAWRAGFVWPRRWTWVFVAYGAVALLIMDLRGVAVQAGALYEPYAHSLGGIVDHPYLASLASQMLFFFKYLGLWLIPYPGWMSIDLQHEMPGYVLPWLAIPAVVLFTGYLVLGGALVLRGGRRGLYGLLMLWSALLFGTELWATRLNESFVLYRSYLWMPFVPLLVVALLVAVAERWTPVPGRRRGVVLGAVVLLLLACVPALVDRLQSMSSRLRVWQDAVEKNAGSNWPGVARSYDNLGTVYGVAGDLATAERYFNLALQYNPRWASAYCNLAYKHLQAGQPFLARRTYQLAVAASLRDPCLDRTYWVLMRQGVP